MTETARRRTLIAVAVLGGAALLAFSAPLGTFTIDDSNYLATVVALRSGGLSLPVPETLGASAQWYAFDPFPPLRGPPRLPVMPTAPALWAPFALPFSALGLRGLMMMNALSFTLTVVLVHRLCAMHAKNNRSALLAAAVFALGSFSLEYAQGIWPHMFSVLLITAACVAAARARATELLRWASAAGLLAGIAVGVRYQNVVLAGALLVGLALLGARRLRHSAAYLAGALWPLLLSAWINFERLGIFHPATKGRGYGTVGAASAATTAGRFEDAALSFWSRVVDFAVHPPIPSPSALGSPWSVDAELGVFVAEGAVKKALLQSAPWVALAWMMMALAWRRTKEPRGADTEARALSLLPAALIGAFTLAGTSAHDGLCFNARYLLELLPGAAVVVGWGFDRALWGRASWWVGGLVGGALVGLSGFAEPYSVFRSMMIHYVPLALAAACVGAALAWKRRPAFASAVVSVSVVWALGVHVIDDLPASYRMRAENAAQLRAARQLVGQGCGVFVYGIERDALWPLWALDDCLILDLGKDGGRDGPRLAAALIAQGRRVFIHDAVPPAILGWVVGQGRLAAVPAGAALKELRPL